MTEAAAPGCSCAESCAGLCGGPTRSQRRPCARQAPESELSARTGQRCLRKSSYCERRPFRRIFTSSSMVSPCGIARSHRFAGPGRPPGEHRRKESQYNTGIGEEIAIRRVEAAGTAGADLSRQGFFREDPGPLQNMAEGIDKPGDARVRSPCKIDTIFHCPEHHHAEVLVRRARAPKPGVVGDGHHIISAQIYKATHQVRKDHFKADDHTESAAGTLHHFWSIAGKKVSDSHDELIEKPKDVLERNVFSERHEMDLVVAVQNSSIGADQERAVQQA